MGITVLVDRLAFDQLHHKIRHAFFSGSAIEQPSDIGMIKVGQNLPLFLEATKDKTGSFAGVYQLDRDLFFKLIVSPDGAVNFTHTPAAQVLNDSVLGNPLANHLDDPAFVGRGILF